jgi:hypothetical protein
MGILRHLPVRIDVLLQWELTCSVVALLVLTTIREPRWAIAYLVVFGLGTIAGMVVITMMMGGPSPAPAYGSTAACRWHRGLISVGFGLFITFQIGFVDGLFTSHPS